MGLSVVVFLVVFATVVTGVLYFSGCLRGGARVRRRMEAEFGAQRDQPLVTPLYKNLDEMKLEPGSSLDPEAQRPKPPPRQMSARLRALLEQANVRWTLKQLLVIAAVVSFVLGLAGWFFGGLFLGLPGVAAGAAAPLVYVHMKRNARRQKYLKQLPSAFDLMSRVIRAGQSVMQALQAVGDTFEDPIAGDFSDCLKQQNLGLRPEVAFQEMAERSRILEMRIFAMAMLIQRQTGGNLSEVLDRLGNLVRARIKLKQQVRTLTAEGRLQGWTLVALPFVVLGVMMVVNRPYAMVLFEHVPLLVATVVSMGLGLLWIRKIVNIEN